MKTLITAAGLAALTCPALAGVPVGRGEIFAAVTGMTTYDSNVYGTPDATGDFSTTLAPRLTYLRQAGLIESEANLGVSFIRYLEETALDAENLDANAALRIPSSDLRNYSGSVYAAYLETSDLDTDLNARVNTQTTSFEARSALVTGPRTDLAFNASHVDAQRSVASDQQTLASELAYGYADFFNGNNLRLVANYDALQSSGENARDAPLDQKSYTLTAGLNRLFAHDTLRVGVNYGYRILERSAAETAEGDTTEGGSVISASVDGPFLPKKHFPKIESRFGITYEDAAAPGIDDTGSKELTGYLSLSWQARERTRVSFSAHRSQRLSADDLSVLSTYVRLGLDQTLRTNLTGSLTAGYDWSSYSTVGREDRTASLNAGLRYQFSRSWDASLTYAFSSTTSDVVASEYDRHLVSLGISYRF
ncbi:MAG: outer membrane beta-barrel protein [Burkholderiales bacterium]|nr:outer membrane beta-barrel protein [Opitutaceae bacterium]